MIISNVRREYFFIESLVSHFATTLPSGRFLEERGFMPDLRLPDREEFTPNLTLDSPEDFFVDIDPTPEEGQKGIVDFDLRFGNDVYSSDLVMERVSERDLSSMSHRRLKDGEEFVMTPDESGQKVFYVTSAEQVRFSPNLEIIVDSKSTTGRVGCMSHGAGFTQDGRLITILQPYSFPLLVRAGKTRLSQAVIRYKDTTYMTSGEILNSGEVDFLDDKEITKSILAGAISPKGLRMQFDTGLAYKAKKCSEPVDMDVKGALDWRKYFELVEGNSSIACEASTLYLLGSLGVVKLGAVCGILSREQEVLTGAGAWGHFAGIFQPFYIGGITMEFYSHTRRKVHTGDSAGVVLFDLVDLSPTESRPKDYGGSYQHQKPPRLPKMFKEN